MLLPVAPPRTESLTLEDGTRLVADLWYPQGPGPFPVLLMRQAYGRRIGTSLCYAPPEWYAAHGYLVILQDVRGRGDSTGTFDLFTHEAEDGRQTIDWAAALPGSNGRVGMFGFSFQGSNQFLAASKAGPALRALAPAMIGWDLARDWAYENGAFALRANIGWATQLAAETARCQGAHADQAQLFTASRALSFSGPRPAAPAHDALLARYSHYATWRDTPIDAPYWETISPSAHREAIIARAPATLLIGGWYDSHLPGTIAAYQALAPFMPTRLVVGPWAHFPWGRRTGMRDFGADAITTIDQQQIAWFDRWLKDDPTPTPERGTCLFDMGADLWRTFDSLPAAEATLHLSGTGRAAIDPRDGTLGAEARTHTVIPHESVTLDPWRPATAVGGVFGVPPGPINRAQADERADVLTFTTAPFTTPHLLAGTVSVTLDIESAAISADLHAVLSRVLPDGTTHPLCEGYATFTPGSVTLPLRATCCTLAPGDRLRLSLSPACFPAFPVNPGTGLPPWQASLADLDVVTLRLLHAGSTLHLPLRPLPEATTPGDDQ